VCVLSDAGILYAMKHRGLKIEPFIAQNLQPASVDLTLHEEIQQDIPIDIIDLSMFEGDVPTFATPLGAAGIFFLQPGDFIRGATAERFTIPNGMVAKLDGKSTLARVGLQIEAAGYVDPGWGRDKPRPLTLEIVNLGKHVLMLKAGMKICQIRFEFTDTDSNRLYGDKELGSHYADSEGPVSARFGSRSGGSRDS
jgi:dCTP deaminase